MFRPYAEESADSFEYDVEYETFKQAKDRASSWNK